MAQYTLDPAPPLLDENIYKYQMQGGPSYVGMEPPQPQGVTSPLGSIMGLRHQLPSVSPTGGAEQVQTRSIGPTNEELIAQGFRGAQMPPNWGGGGTDPQGPDVPPQTAPAGFDAERFGPVGGGDMGASSFDSGGAVSDDGSGQGMPPAPAPAGGRLGAFGPILNGLGAGIAANNMAVGIGAMNNRRDILYRRQQYEYERAQAERAAAQEQKQKQVAQSATVSFLEKRFGKDDERVQLAKANPELAGMMVKEMLQSPDKPTPYTDAAKAEADFQNGFISKELRDQQISAAGQVATPKLTEIGSARKEYLTAPAVREYDVIRTQYQNMRDAATDALVNGGGQAALNVVYAYMKMLSPESTVMQGEKASAENTGNVPQKIWGLYNSIRDGNPFDKKMLEGFIRNADNIYKVRAGALQRHNQYYAPVREGMGVPPQLWPFVEPMQFDPLELPNTDADAATRPDAAAVPQPVPGGGPRIIAPGVEEMP